MYVAQFEVSVLQSCCCFTKLQQCNVANVGIYSYAYISRAEQKQMHNNKPDQPTFGMILRFKQGQHLWVTCVEFTYTLFYTPPLPEVADVTQKRIWRQNEFPIGVFQVFHLAMKE